MKGLLSDVVGWGSFLGPVIAFGGLMGGGGGMLLFGTAWAFIGWAFIFSQIDEEKRKKEREERLAQEAQKPGWMR